MLRYFLFTVSAPTEPYTLSLHDALPISRSYRLGAITLERSPRIAGRGDDPSERADRVRGAGSFPRAVVRSEEHTSELQSRRDLVCRLLLEKKKANNAWVGKTQAVGHQV